MNPFAIVPVKTSVYPAGISFSSTVYLISVPSASYFGLPVNVVVHSPPAVSSFSSITAELPTFLSTTFAEVLAGPTHTLVTDTSTFSLFVFVIVNPLAIVPARSDVYPDGMSFSSTIYLISVPLASYFG